MYKLHLCLTYITSLQPERKTIGCLRTLLTASKQFPEAKVVRAVLKISESAPST